MKKSKIEIVYRSTDEIYELMNNPRKITREQMKKLDQSIKDNSDYFEARPIILSGRTGKMVIIATIATPLAYLKPREEDR